MNVVCNCGGRDLLAVQEDRNLPPAQCGAHSEDAAFRCGLGDREVT